MKMGSVRNQPLICILKAVNLSNHLYPVFPVSALLGKPLQCASRLLFGPLHIKEALPHHFPSLALSVDLYPEAVCCLLSQGGHCDGRRRAPCSARHL